MPNSPSSPVTVVMATRDRRADALLALAHLEALEPPSPLVVVDNASSDGTAQAVGRAFPHVDVVRLADNIGACARNVGARRATTPYVAFSDDDSWWADGALERAATVLDDHPRVAVVMARLVVGQQNSLDATCAQMATAPLGTLEGTPYPRIVGFFACGTVVRRSAFLAVGGFDPVVRFPGEEQLLAMDLMAGGWQLVHVDDVVAHHHPQPRGDRSDRESDIIRSQLLTTWLREPWWVCLRETGLATARAWRSPQHRRALREALGRAREVRPRRRVAPPRVRRDVARARG
ncbi:glycosyltransferase [Phycicoccus sp. 3266]|uniref:glycosyltransferase family 2 protein n=1 Tax=Phycicoccus sp. 3266 TaxID=2817751 RepID=UPI00286703E9|nr:glycosyltransferase [Phycicoccus sp. 3266]MDR6864735.1 GT2 family glycosyltransferase [Phycicoccus sp. 3266]